CVLRERGSPFTGEETTPRGGGEEPRIWYADREVVGRCGLRQLDWRQRLPSRKRLDRTRGRTALCRVTQWNALADVRASADTADQHVIGGQLLVGDSNGVPRYAQTLRQFSRRWEPLSGAEAAVENGAEQLAVDLHGQLAALPERDVHVHSGQCEMKETEKTERTDQHGETEQRRFLVKMCSPFLRCSV